MTSGVSESKSSSASKTSEVSGAQTTSGERSVASSLDRSMSKVSARDVQAEAATVTRGNLVTDGVERVARLDNNRAVDRVATPADEVAVTPTDPAATTPAPTLEKGAKGPEVEALQQRLTDLGYDLGTVDGDYGRMTERAVRSFQLNNDLPLTGVADATTQERVNSPEAKAPDPNKREFPIYEPGSPEQIALFEDAARQAGLPEEWASSPGLINLLRSESGGEVGKPNYTYGNAIQSDPSRWHEVHDELRDGRITAESSATGLGQLLLSNVDAYYPSGRQGIGNPTEEAIGMMRYIEDRYGTPDAAWEQYNTHHEGY